MDGIWRKWIRPEEWDAETDREQQKAFMEEVESRKIRARTGKDILIWGNSMKGTFLVKEAYYLVEQQVATVGNQKWKIIWGSNWWPKITLFTWLVVKGKNLTWEKIQKKGISGPPRCYLCNTEAETQEHLLNNCVYTRKIWFETRILFRKSEGNLRDINETIFQWHTKKFQCKAIRRAWGFIVGFVIWMVWKERNRRIFQDKSKGFETIWKRIVSSVREMILAEKWEEDDWKADQNEEQILMKLNLNYEMVHTKKVQGNSRNAQSSDEFTYPRDKFMNLNFDGASKGNPGNAGFGGIFRDSQKTTR